MKNSNIFSLVFAEIGIFKRNIAFYWITKYSRYLLI